MTFCNSYFTTKNFPSSGLTIFGPHCFASKSVAWIRFLWMMRHFWESLKIRSSQNNLDDYRHDKHHHLQLWIKMERANVTSKCNDNIQHFQHWPVFQIGLHSPYIPTKSNRIHWRRFRLSVNVDCWYIYRIRIKDVAVIQVTLVCVGWLWIFGVLHETNRYRDKVDIYIDM